MTRLASYFRYYSALAFSCVYLGCAQSTGTEQQVSAIEKDPFCTLGSIIIGWDMPPDEARDDDFSAAEWCIFAMKDDGRSRQSDELLEDLDACTARVGDEQEQSPESLRKERVVRECIADGQGTVSVTDWQGMVDGCLGDGHFDSGSEYYVRPYEWVLKAEAELGEWSQIAEKWERKCEKKKKEGSTVDVHESAPAGGL